MRIIFEYYFNEVKKEFISTCDSEFKGDYIPLISYLNDDLGDKSEYKEFLKDILNILINNREEDISSNSWGVDVVGDNVYIFFLYDSDNKQYQIKLPKIEFIFIIRRWIDFLNKSIKDPNYQEVIDSEDAYK